MKWKNQDPLENALEEMLLKLIEHGPERFVDNVRTQLIVTKIGSSTFPMTVNEREYDTTYVCSVYTALISYAKSELQKLHHAPTEIFLHGLIRCLGLLLRSISVDRILAANNMLLSTNLYPSEPLLTSDIQQWTVEKSQAYPKHVLLFRSLNAHTNKNLIKCLKELGYLLVPSRQVYMFDQTLKNPMEHHNFRVDLKLLQRTTLQKVENHDIEPTDYERMAELYRFLYVDKYSIFNPIFNAQYLKHAHQTGFCQFFGLRSSSGILEAIVGRYARGKVVTAPIVGYNPHLPKNLGLYRMLMAHTIQYALTHNLILNLSSGASEFKRLRGGVPFMEYSAVYLKHLRHPWHKMVWKILGFLLNTLGVFIMRKFKL